MFNETGVITRQLYPFHDRKSFEPSVNLRYKLNNEATIRKAVIDAVSPATGSWISLELNVSLMYNGVT